MAVALACGLGWTSGAGAATVTVTGIGDTVAVDGAVTLREAITSINSGANVNADVVATGTYGSGDTIHFGIPGAGPHTILVGALPLPTLNLPVVIDGYSEPGSSANTLVTGDDAVLNIVLQGTTAGVHGLTFFQGASGSTVRGLVLQGHFFAIQLQASNVTVAGNFIGTDAAGGSAAGNAVGINITNGNLGNNTLGGAAPADRNLISGNSGSAIIINSQLPNSVLGNYIGVNAAGTAALANAGAGIVFGSLGGVTIGGPAVGGATAQAGTGAGNVISGNGFNGIQVQISGGTTVGAGTIAGNLIGLNATGTAAIPNTGTGILLEDVDLASSGIPRLGPVEIGGPAAGAGNVISGHGTGVIARAVGTNLRRNLIGTDATGTVAIPNTFGVEISTVNGFEATATLGGPLANEGNVISGNSSDGVRVFLATATLRGNRIGVASNDAPLGNGGFGVFVDSSAALLGGTLPNDGNVIANNGDTGVQVRIGSPAVRNASDAMIRYNRIFNNGVGPLTGLGINNSAPDVVTANDPSDGDSGPNGLQNFPVITSATVAGGNVTVSGTLNSTANTLFDIDLFASTSCDPLGHGEGQTVLGDLDVTTDAAGNASFGPVVLPIPAGQTIVTATATNPVDQSSEFSACVTATGGGPTLPTLAIDSVADAEGDAGATPFAFTVTLSAASATPVTVAYATADGTATIADLDYASASGILTFSPGGPLTQQILIDVLGDTTVEPDESFTVTLSSPSGATLQTAVGTGTILNDDILGPGPEAEIPTLSQWGLLLLVASLVLAGLQRLAARRRRA